MFGGFAAVLAAMMMQAAATSEDAAVRFGARPEVEQASLSPDGTKLSYLGPVKGQGSALFIVPLDGSSNPKPVVVADGNPERLSDCSWVSNERLVCTIYSTTELAQTGDLAVVSRYVGVDSDGSKQKVLFQGSNDRQIGVALHAGNIIDWLPDEDGKVLMRREYLPENSIGTLVASRDEGWGVDRVDTRTGQSSKEEAPRKSAQNFITDGRGNVRIVEMQRLTDEGYETKEITYYYRRKGSREWEELSVVGQEGGTFHPYAIDPDLNVAYGLKRKDGRRAAYSVALDGTMKETLIYAHPQVDVDGFASIGRRGRIVGVTYATDRRETVYFDPELKKLASSLSKAMSNLPLIEFVDSSVDESKLLIWAGSDTNPGRYYLFDRQTKRLGELLPNRPLLANTPLASVKAIKYPARDGTSIPAYLTLPPGKEDAKGLPAIVLPHGGPHSRDEWGFDWLPQYFANRGFAVLQPNFRGSTGYGDAWFQKNGYRSWATAVGDVSDGGRWLIAQGVDADKLAIVGWSYGGYAALQSAVVDPQLFKAVVAVAPVTDFELLKEQSRNWSNYRIMREFIGSGPHIEQGSPARNADKIKVPVLLFHGTHDSDVEVRQSRLMADRLKAAGAKADLVIYDKRDHHLEDSTIRVDLLTKSDAFIRKSLGM